MWALLLAATLAQAPSHPASPAQLLASQPAPSESERHDVAVVVVSPSEGDARLSRQLEAEVRMLLGRAGLVVQDAAETQRLLGAQRPSDCRTNRTCISLLGRSVGVPLMVRVEATTIDTDLAIAVQAVRSEDGEDFGELNFVTTTAAWESDLQTRLTPWAEALRARLPPRPEPSPPVPAAPTAQGIEAAPSVTLVQTPPQPERTSLRPAALGAAVVGGVGVLGGTGFFLHALDVHHRLTESSLEGAPLTSDEARAQVAAGERSQQIARIAYGVGAAALLTAGALLLLDGGDGAQTAGGEASVRPVAISAGPGGVLVQGSF